MNQLILLRHGQSMWNLANRFTGWVDVPLSQAGIAEAQRAGETLADVRVEAVVMSTLQRAQQTAMIAMAYQSSNAVPIVVHNDPAMSDRQVVHSLEAQAQSVPCYIDMRLNERQYGELQGLDKQQTRDKYGEEQVHIWRRSYDIPPPGGESLEMTAKRSIPCLQDTIIPLLREKNCVLVAAHGNSLRSIVMEIEGLTREQVLELEIPTGVPRCYQFDGQEGWTHLT